MTHRGVEYTLAPDGTVSYCRNGRDWVSLGGTPSTTMPQAREMVLAELRRLDAIPIDATMEVKDL